MLIPGEIIPMMAIGVALVAVTGRVIIQPIVQAIMRMTEQRVAPPPDLSRLEQRLSTLEDRLGSMEGSMDRVLADRDFYQQLQSGKTQPPAAGS